MSIGAEAILARVESLDVERDWSKILSLRDQALVSVARLVLARPRFAFVDNLERTLGVGQLAAVLRLFTESQITYVAMGGENTIAHCDDVLDLAGDGKWQLRSRREGAATTEATKGSRTII
jgi:putative ATP-binding cassette transporter